MTPLAATAAAGGFSDERLAELASNLLALGATFALTPLLLGGASVFATALWRLEPLSLLMATTGGLLLLLARAEDGSIAGRRRR